MILIILFCLLVAAPAGAIFYHDFMMAYEKSPDDPLSVLVFSDLGWLWKTYSPDTFVWVREHVSTAFWQYYMVPALQETALIITATPLFFIYTALIALKVFGFWPFSGRGILMNRPSYEDLKREKVMRDLKKKKEAARHAAQTETDSTSN